MKANIKHKNKSGIYCIKNIINNKVYVGKAKCIYKRIVNHISSLNSKNSKSSNIYLINSWHKYGKDNFEYFVLEYLELNEDLLSKRESYWINKLESLNKKKGYNLIFNSDSKLIVSESTRIKCSLHMKKRHSSGEEALQKSIFFKKFWKENPNIKKTMSENVSKSKQIYDFYQYDKNMNLIKIWTSVKEIIKYNPDYKWQQIYSVCNGYKPSAYGFIWKKEIKI